MIVRADDESIRYLKDAMDEDDPDRADWLLDRSMSPSPGSHPLSFWTKRRILEESRWLLSPSEMQTLRLMSLEDLRSLFLRKDGTYLCGSATGRARHTVYYALDTVFMREFLRHRGPVQDGTPSVN